jgi:hypothetical protein
MESLAQNSVKESPQPKCFEGINRARDILREIGERWNDRLILEGNSYVEYYRRGRMALIVCLKNSFPVQSEPVGILRKVGLPIRREDIPVLIFKANIRESHYLKHWDEQLMLVENAHIVQGPEGPIPSLVGFYFIDNKIPQLNGARVTGKTLLFQSSVNLSYKFMPLISDWKARPVIGFPSQAIECTVVHEIKSASHIVQSISDDESSIADREMSEKSNEDFVTPFLFLDSDGVKIRSGKGRNEFVQVMDVLHGPFNLFP